MRLLKHARLAAFVMLGVVTAYGVYQFATGDWGAAMEYWRGKVAVLPQVFVLASLDVALEGIAWLWIYSRFGMRSWDSGGVSAFLAGRAGLLLPVQLGRLIRPDAMHRLHRGAARDCIKAEAVVFVLDIASVGALLVGLVAAFAHPAAGPVAALAVIALLLLVGNRLANRLSGTHLSLPTSFWWTWQTFAIVMIQLCGWIAHGAALYLLVRDLPGQTGLWQAVFFSAGSAVVGSGSGLPGGVGATEGLLGASLSLMQVPQVHLALAVGGFRLLTFWIWLPVGWAALVAIRRRGARMGTPASVGSTVSATS